jgi:hypothetical protein
MTQAGTMVGLARVEVEVDEVYALPLASNVDRFFAWVSRVLHAAS